MPEQFSTAARGGAVSEPPNIISSHAAYFFLPLPEPLSIPQGTVQRFVDTTPIERVRAERLPTHHLRASIRIHQSSRPAAAATTVASLFQLAEQALPASDKEPPLEDSRGSSSEPPLEAVTVAEVLVPFDAPTTAGTDFAGALSNAFDRALHSVRELQRAFYLVRRLPISLVTRETLPFGVPVGIREIDHTGDSFDVSISLYLLNSNLVTTPGTNDWSDDDRTALRTALTHRSNEGAFALSLDFMRESAISLTKAGDYRSAILFAATACEAMFDDLLSHMLWEEGARPEDAAPAFDSSLTKRVKRDFHSRLGGNWSVDTSGPLQDWFVQVAGVRNRAVHGGVEPSIDQARSALNVTESLLTHLGDLVANQLATYPRTALVLPGEQGLKRRRKWTLALERLQHDPSEVPWRETFRRWRTAMQRARTDSPILTRPSLEAATVLLVIHPDSEEGWVVHDASAEMASPASTADIAISDEELTQLDALRAHLRGTQFDSPVSIAMWDARIAPSMKANWMPEYRLVPRTGVLVHGRDLDPPRSADQSG